METAMTRKARGLAGILTPLLAALVSCSAAIAATALADRNAASAPEPSADTLARPGNIRTWITLGTTLRMRRDNPNAPDEMRHVQIEPDAYAKLIENSRLPDGARLAVTFYALKSDASATPLLYAPDSERFFGLEVLDASHPDGRRFYAFAPGATTAAALPPGNACAVCHNEKGSFQGVFAHHYPAISQFAERTPTP
jgi:hypothetical protein